jgi:hypothetical protein
MATVPAARVREKEYSPPPVNSDFYKIAGEHRGSLRAIYKDRARARAALVSFRTILRIDAITPTSMSIGLKPSCREATDTPAILKSLTQAREQPSSKPPCCVLNSIMAWRTHRGLATTRLRRIDAPSLRFGCDIGASIESSSYHYPKACSGGWRSRHTFAISAFTI